MFFNKKAQSLSMQTIIVAALALLVLAIIALIFTGRIGALNSEMGSCESGGGVCFQNIRSCKDVTSDPSTEYYGKIGRSITKECPNSGTCCLFA